MDTHRYLKFADDLDSSIKDLPTLPSNYDIFVEMVKKCSRHNIPRGCRTNYIQGLTDDSKILYEDYIKHFQNDPFSVDTIESGENLTEAIMEGRKRKWQEFIQSTDMTHSSRKAWKTIRILGNDYTKSQPRSQVTADQVAHQLLLNSQGNPNHHPRRAKLPKATAECSQGVSRFYKTFLLERPMYRHQGYEKQQSSRAWWHPLWADQALWTWCTAVAAWHVQQKLLCEQQQDTKAVEES